jgi:hypothetical protein
LSNRCIAIPWAKLGDTQRIGKDLLGDYVLPPTGNVFNLLLYPIGFTVTRELGFWGFDGRAPDDKYFWSNSPNQSYRPEAFAEMRERYPAFFAEMIPSSNPLKYVRELHGESLEREFRQAEADGVRHHMMHPSWTETFASRYVGRLSYPEYQTLLKSGAVEEAFRDTMAAPFWS